VHQVETPAWDWLRAPYALKVQFLIHWQAVKLLRKGLSFHSNTTCPLASSAGAISHGAMGALALLAVLLVAAAATLIAKVIGPALGATELNNATSNDSLECL